MEPLLRGRLLGGAEPAVQQPDAQPLQLVVDQSVVGLLRRCDLDLLALELLLIPHGGDCTLDLGEPRLGTSHIRVEACLVPQLKVIAHTYDCDLSIQAREFSQGCGDQDPSLLVDGAILGPRNLEANQLLNVGIEDEGLLQVR